MLKSYIDKLAEPISWISTSRTSLEKMASKEDEGLEYVYGYAAFTFKAMEKVDKVASMVANKALSIPVAGPILALGARFLEVLAIGTIVSVSTLLAVAALVVYLGGAILLGLFAALFVNGAKLFGYFPDEVTFLGTTYLG